MTVAITRTDVSAAALRREAGRSDGAAAARRMLAIALVLEGYSRVDAARQCGMDHHLREGGWAAVSVNTVPERAFATRVDAIIGRHAPERAATGARYFCLGNAGLLRSLFTAAGFREIETFTEARRYPFSSFAAYFKPIEDGQGPTGQAYVALPTEIQQLVREDARRQLEGNTAIGGPVEMEVELLFGCGR
jgi:hypothetical protein